MGAAISGSALAIGRGISKSTSGVSEFTGGGNRIELWADKCWMYLRVFIFDSIDVHLL